MICDLIPYYSVLELQHFFFCETRNAQKNPSNTTPIKHQFKTSKSQPAISRTNMSYALVATVPIMVTNVGVRCYKYRKACTMKKNLKALLHEENVESFELLGSSRVQVDARMNLSLTRLKNAFRTLKREMVAIEIVEKHTFQRHTLLLLFKTKFWDDVNSPLTAQSIIGNIKMLETRFHSDDGTNVVFTRDVQIVQTPIDDDKNVYVVAIENKETTKFHHRSKEWRLTPAEDTDVENFHTLLNF